MQVRKTLLYTSLTLKNLARTDCSVEYSDFFLFVPKSCGKYVSKFLWLVSKRISSLQCNVYTLLQFTLAKRKGSFHKMLKIYIIIYSLLDSVILTMAAVVQQCFRNKRAATSATSPMSCPCLLRSVMTMDARKEYLSSV